MVSEPDLDALVSPADWERAAQAALNPAAHAYIAGGASEEITLDDNRAAWSRLALVPRALVGVGRRDPSIELLGRRRPHPVLIAPTAYQRLAHPEGECDTARAAAATGTIMCLSTLATTSPEALAAAAPDAPRWFQLYVFRDRGVSRELVARAAGSGFEALVVTVDLTLFGRRERELRSGEAHPPEVASASAAGVSVGTPASLQALVDPDLRWSDIERFAAESPLPVIVKGLLRTEDSRRALALGARAVLIGRPVVYGLAVAGAAGVQRVIETLLSEVDNALGLAGCPVATELDRSFVAAAPWARR